jgi:hypothetical protein
MYGMSEGAEVYALASPLVDMPLVVTREYDGFNSEIGTTHSYAKAISLVKEHGLHNTASYYATIRILRDGVILETFDFPPYRSDYKGD